MAQLDGKIAIVTGYHGGIVQRRNQPQPTPAMRARQKINRERPVHQSCSGPSARTARRLDAPAPAASGGAKTVGSDVTRPYATAQNVRKCQKLEGGYER
jgi:hypothetical protein